MITLILNIRNTKMSKTKSVSSRNLPSNGAKRKSKKEKNE